MSHAISPFKVNLSFILLFLLFITFSFSVYASVNKPKEIELSELARCVDNDGVCYIILKRDNYLFSQDVYIHPHHILLIEPGTILEFDNNSMIFSQGTIVANGTKERPITFKGYKGSAWRGIILENSLPVYHTENIFDFFYSPMEKKLHERQTLRASWDHFSKINSIIPDSYIDNVKNGNIFNNCIFQDISYLHKNTTTTNDCDELCRKKSKGLKSYLRPLNHRAAIEARNSSLIVSSSKFERVMNLGGILYWNSYAAIYGNEFKSDGNNIHKVIHSRASVSIIHDNLIEDSSPPQSCRDAIWVLWSDDIISSNKIISKSDDSIDLKSGSHLVFDNTVSSTGDEGIDVDDYGMAVIYNNSVMKSREAAISIANGSEAVIVSNLIADTFADGSFGFQFTNKTSVLLKGNNLVNNSTDIACLSKSAFKKSHYGERYIFVINSSEDDQKLNISIDDGCNLSFLEERDLTSAGDKINTAQIKTLNLKIIDEAKSKVKIISDFLNNDLAQKNFIENVIKKIERDNTFYHRE